jgi:hypothetical protein
MTVNMMRMSLGDMIVCCALRMFSDIVQRLYNDEKAFQTHIERLLFLIDGDFICVKNAPQYHLQMIYPDRNIIVIFSGAFQPI